MGNSSSSATRAEEDVTFSPGSSGGDTATRHQRNRSASLTRRIVKASKPQPSDSKEDEEQEEEEESLTSPRGTDDDDDDDDKPAKHGKSHTVPKVIAESPEVARELELEQAKESRQERIQNMSNRRRTKRNQTMQERRSKPNIPKKDELQANPFSRFLSVFSVEPAHPEHKRAFEGSPDLGEPEEKRLRPTDLSAEDQEKVGAEVSETTSPGGMLSSGTALAAAVAVAAVAIAAIIRLKRSS